MLMTIISEIYWYLAPLILKPIRAMTRVIYLNNSLHKLVMLLDDRNIQSLQMICGNLFYYQEAKLNLFAINKDTMGTT